MQLIIWLIFFLIPFAAMGKGCDNAYCTVSATGVLFGNYQPLNNGPSTTTGTIVVNCTSNIKKLNGCGVVVSLSKGNGSYSNRQMKSGSKTLNYNLYTDSSYTSIFGDGSDRTQTVADKCSSKQTLPPFSCKINFTVYGKVDGKQTNTNPSTYSDTITTTVDY